MEVGSKGVHQNILKQMTLEEYRNSLRVASELEQKIAQICQISGGGIFKIDVTRMKNDKEELDKALNELNKQIVEISEGKLNGQVKRSVFQDYLVGLGLKREDLTSKRVGDKKFFDILYEYNPELSNLFRQYRSLNGDFRRLKNLLKTLNNNHEVNNMFSLLDKTVKEFRTMFFNEQRDTFYERENALTIFKYAKPPEGEYFIDICIADDLTYFLLNETGNEILTEVYERMDETRIKGFNNLNRDIASCLFEVDVENVTENQCNIVQKLFYSTMLFKDNELFEKLIKEIKISDGLKLVNDLYEYKKFITKRFYSSNGSQLMYRDFSDLVKIVLVKITEELPYLKLAFVDYHTMTFRVDKNLLPEGLKDKLKNIYKESVPAKWSEPKIYCNIRE